MRHTYLYPLPESARFLWMLARQDPADLFGHPDDTHRAGWQTAIRLAEELGHARDTIMRLIADAPRVCVGEGYVIPGSHTEDGGRHHALTPGVERLTHFFWDAPKASKALTFRAVRIARKAPAPGSGSPNEIGDFLTAHRGQMIIPVWM